MVTLQLELTVTVRRFYSKSNQINLMAALDIHGNSPLSDTHNDGAFYPAQRVAPLDIESTVESKVNFVDSLSNFGDVLLAENPRLNSIQTPLQATNSAVSSKLNY